jgi:hypothetical protein
MGDHYRFYISIRIRAFAHSFPSRSGYQAPVFFLQHCPLVPWQPLVPVDPEVPVAPEVLEEPEVPVVPEDWVPVVLPLQQLPPFLHWLLFWPAHCFFCVPVAVLAVVSEEVVVVP